MTKGAQIKTSINFLPIQALKILKSIGRSDKMQHNNGFYVFHKMTDLYQPDVSSILRKDVVKII